MTAAAGVLVKPQQNTLPNANHDDRTNLASGPQEKSSWMATVADKMPSVFASSGSEEGKTSSEDTESGGETGSPVPEREERPQADENVPRIRYVKSDSNIRLTGGNNASPASSEQNATTPHHDRVVNASSLRVADGSSPLESREQSPTPHTPDNAAGWAKLFSAADGWLDRLRGAMATEAGDEINHDPAVAGEQNHLKDTVPPGRRSPGAPSPPMPRYATTSAISESSKSRKIAPSIMRLKGSHHDESPAHRHFSTADMDSGEHEHHGGIPGISPQRWKEIRSTLRFINFTKKKKEEETKHDYEKSAELIAELSAGAPAAVILASSFKRDEKGRPRLPILLEQLNVKITDSTGPEDRQHTMFRIELEYGSGPARMKWVVHRDFRDFFTLHSRLRILNIQRNIYSSTTAGTIGVTNAPDIPHFPKSAIPYLRGVRGLMDESDRDKLLKRDRVGLHSRPSEISLAAEEGPVTRHPGPTNVHDRSRSQSQQTPQKHFRFVEHQRHQLEVYLKSLIKLMIFQGEANRICKFLELSAMGLRLSIEKSYHGKEGQLSIISTSSSRPWRAQNLTPSHIISVFKRYKPKWFLVRHSYILVVESMWDIVPIDVIMVDSDFKYSRKASPWHTEESNASVGEEAGSKHHKSITRSVQESAKLRVALKLENSERKLKLLALSEKQMKQWIDSIESMWRRTLWSSSHRFESFAPVRYNVSAQWFVDGRDYFWNVSHAIDMAKDVIYIHDWWLSPEIYLRRPAHGNQQWRLDRLLKRKAEQGVKIFVILYRNVGAAVPIDSQYTKQSLLDLHPNIYVARSPNQFRQNILFWAHHEKLVIIDHVIVFLGGLDLCFGRWDTPQHVLTDNKPTGFDRGSIVDFGQDTQLWVGKDYSNARVQDFYELNKPYDDMYDRAKVPRMPWHDVHMQMVGQPARDAARHFVQRWNYLIRQKRSTRPAPVLLPPPDFTEAELEAMGHVGTCEVQLLRSACGWSLGLRNDKVEHSIVNAYLKAIEQSEHFVYIENQFFISSTTVDGTVIENQIGDALVERIMRAHKHDENWRAVIIIPLMPGFEAEVDQQDGTSVRLIMQCQFRSISRGPDSLFGRLERAGIEPGDYIQFFALRKWGFVGPNRQLVTEQLYIHAKIMIVDDRVAIIGSANINERSMRGSRDSEVAAFVRDTDQIESTMGGQAYMVGRFPHTLRVRLMREHLGIDVDALEQIQRQAASPVHGAPETIALDRNGQNIWTAVEKLRDIGARPQTLVQDRVTTDDEVMYEAHEGEVDGTNNDAGSSSWSMASSIAGPSNSGHRKNTTSLDGPVIDDDVISDFSHGDYPPSDRLMETELQELDSNQGHEVDKEYRAADVAGYGPDRMYESGQAEANMEEAVRRRIQNSGVFKAKGREYSRDIALPAQLYPSKTTIKKAKEQPKQLDVNLEPHHEGPVDFKQRIKSLTLSPAKCYLSDHEMREILETDTTTLKSISPLSFEDPLDENFYLDIWLAHALNNTNIYREVFRCQPDNEVRTWKDYKAYIAHGEKFAHMQSGTLFGSSGDRAGRKAGPQNGSGALGIGTAIGGSVRAAPGVTAQQERRMSNASSSSSKAHEDGREHSADSHGRETMMDRLSESDEDVQVVDSNGMPNRRRRAPTDGTSAAHTHPGTTRRGRRKRSNTIDSIMDSDAAEDMLNEIRGHLIVFPTDWLLKEEEAGNWFYNIDRIPPIEIYD
ncbi:hypothetical protein V1525DRAFT_394954 [Lipomyces kononenkoae]|uniref:Uncharacterized protein n=1 Tax=Lipomyces kononenkoae TaxID=34357 RepID=A0ACC3TAI4_LIPKO